MFVDIETEKGKFPNSKYSIDNVDFDKIIISSKVSFGEKVLK